MEIYSSDTYKASKRDEKLPLLLQQFKPVLIPLLSTLLKASLQQLMSDLPDFYI